MWLGSVGRNGSFGAVVGSQIKEVLLAFALDDSFTSMAMNPTLVPSELLEGRRILLLKLSKRRRRCIQHAAEFSHPLLGLSDTLLSLCYLAFGFGSLLFQLHRLLASGNQKAVAFRNVVRQEAGLIHRTQGCNNWPGSLARPSWQGSAKK